MKSTFLYIILLASIASLCPVHRISAQTSPCDVVQIQPNPNPPVFWSPDSSKYFINIQDSAGIFQIYVGNAGDPNPICISNFYSTGNCCGLFRPWSARNKLQVQWHKSGDFLICAVEKELYNELLFVPYSILLGWLQSGLWMDIWAVKPDGSHWYQLAGTVHGMTGPAFTPDGNTCVWAEAQDTGSLAVDVFGIWTLQRADFEVNNGTPSFTDITDISPAGSRWNEPGNFAPDGESLLMSSDIGISNAEGQDQFILNIITGEVTNLNNSPMVWDEHGIFSPDGKKILFMSSYPYQADTNSYHTFSLKTEFMIMNMDGSGLQQLTNFRDTGYLESHQGIAATGFWTPDGSRIYAQSLIFPDYNNWIIDFSGPCGNELISSTDAVFSETLFSVYPNPAQDILNIETTLALDQASVTIVNTFGQPIKTLTAINGNKISIDVNTLDNGIYFLNLLSGNQRISSIFIVQHESDK